MRSLAMAFPLLSALILSGVAVGCDDAGTTSSSSSSSSGSGGAGGAPVACTDPEATVDMPCGELAFAVSDVKSRKRNHHLSVLAETPAGPFIYVIGGANGGSTLRFVDRFPVNVDGSLGESVEQPQMPTSIGGMAGGLVGKTIVYAGGMKATGTSSDSFFATIADDGTLGTFQKGGGVLQKRMHPGAVVKDDAIYVLGGFSDPDVWDDIVKATVDANGVLGEWTNAGKLPGKRSHMSVTRVGDYVYLAGGLEKSAYINPPDLHDTWVGRFAADGTLGEWTQGPELPLGLATHASFFYGGYLYVGGGIHDKPLDHENRLWRAAIAADHSLGAWEEATAVLGVKRGHVHQFPVFENHVYSISGAIDFDLNSTDQIDIGTFLTP